MQEVLGSILPSSELGISQPLIEGSMNVQTCLALHPFHVPDTYLWILGPEHRDRAGAGAPFNTNTMPRWAWAMQDAITPSLPHSRIPDGQQGGNAGWVESVT